VTSASASEKIEDPVEAVASEILKKADGLEHDAKWLRRWHQWFTVLTILLAVAAPAVVTYTPPVGSELTWKIVAIVITAFATASATIRTVLRFSERYSNSALTAIALKELWAEFQATRQQVLTETKPEYLQQALFRTAAWARKQMFNITRAHLEKDVSAITQQRVDLVEAPGVSPEQLADPQRRVLDPANRVGAGARA